jgi:hypothetical protein
MANHPEGIMEYERYSQLWTKPFYHVLGPLQAHEQHLAADGVQYRPYCWVGTRYIIFSVDHSVMAYIVEKMLDAGVPIIDPLPDETEDEALAHFWTDRLHEFALIPRDPRTSIMPPTHIIYHLDPPQALTMVISVSKYQSTIDNMLVAGAAILPEMPK